MRRRSTTAPKRPSYRGLLILRASRTRATRPILSEFNSSWARVIFLIVCTVAIGKAPYLKWLASKSFVAFHPADWFGLFVFGFFIWLGFTDRTKELFKGMTFLLYYDREQPARRVAWCDSGFEVLLPSEEYG
jgi:hypothetical protein